MLEATVDMQAGDVLERLLAVARRLVPQSGLSLTAAATLARLSREGPSRVSDLAAAEGVTQPAMSQLVGRLERDGFVDRHPSPEDGRSVLTALTPAGAEVLAARREERVRALSALLDRLDDDDRRAVAAALPALRRLLAVSQ
ncbi:MarR family transcriptional regulator [Motilibacter deserti]|uniref:MarR family transcriptional regulator n=1 Tax=Motilibacter deserti TaxID=2714956 RepID=A0ABX0GRI8_9ACTN|nr:MarR family transcriptional regulator [Motilibacter deserti]